MGVIPTDRLLENHFFEPEKICAIIAGGAPEVGTDLYAFLLEKGMYRPNVLTRETFSYLKEVKMWEFVEKLFIKYQKRWSGPDSSVYLFPSRHSLFEPHLRKNGFTIFPDKIFLFLPRMDDKKEIEALFVHEYHHATRMDQLKKEVAAYTLQDSLIMEGLAEMAVAEYVGDEYVASWHRRYSKDLLLAAWETYFKDHLDLPLTDPGHDRLLYGYRIGKPMIGYALGFYIIRLYKQLNRHFSIPATLSTPAETIIAAVQDGIKTSH